MWWVQMRGVLAIVMLLAASCRMPAAAPNGRAHVRAYVMALSAGVVVADELCATASLRLRDRTMALTCDNYYQFARKSLIAADEGIDAGSDYGCNIVRGVIAIQAMASTLRSRGVAVPGVVEDALSIADELTSVTKCELRDGA
jgi:hypothetical protein